MEARQIKQMIHNALGSVRQALRGKLERANGAKQIIILQMEGLADEPFNAAELFQQPGLRSIPLAGMQPIIIPLNGSSANGVVVAMSNGALFVANLQPGEVALFNENDGIANSIVLRNGKIAEITCDTLKIKALLGVEIDTPLVTMTHALDVAENTKTATINITSAAADASQMAGGLQAAGDITANGKSVHDHTHMVNAVGAQTNPPA
ncbi:MAG: phage baseplate assembly protein V [Oxalobacteraceae bacterium]|nr:phage baseplate assembly protein V [Oxalobacteraceae bacterium]